MTSIQWDQLPVEEVAPGIIRQTVHGEQQTMVRYRYAPGAIFPIHAHPQEQITTVLSGVVTFTVDDQQVTLGPGSVAVIPANVPHGARVNGFDAVETLNALSPRRQAAPEIEETRQAAS